MKLLAGRNFIPADTMGAFIVNEAAVKVFGWGSPEQAIGKPFKRGRMLGSIIGVVKDFHFAGLQHAIDPVELHLTRPNAFSRIAVRFETAIREKQWTQMVNRFPQAFTGTRWTLILSMYMK